MDECPKCESDDIEEIEEEYFVCNTCHTTFDSRGCILEEPDILCAEYDE